MDPVDSRTLRLYIGPRPPLDLDDRAVRLGLNPLARARWDDRFEGEAARVKYGSLLTGFTETQLADADVAALPWKWENIGRPEALAFIDDAERAGKRTIVVAGTDCEPIVDTESVVLFHPGPQASARHGRLIFAIPYFFTERFAGDFGSDRKSDRPVVGFCGQAASAHPVRDALQKSQRVWWAARRRIGRLPFNPPPVRGHLRLRAEAIRRLGDDPRIDQRFMIRDDYRAGAVTETERAVTSDEFDQNMIESDYMLCVRGAGNFSARFYEALSFGCIPVFINTDCVLPYEFEVEWRDLLVWVEEDDVAGIGDKVVEFHESLSEQEFLDRKRRCRQLWVDRLSTDGFFSHFAAHLDR